MRLPIVSVAGCDDDDDDDDDADADAAADDGDNDDDDDDDEKDDDDDDDVSDPTIDGSPRFQDCYDDCGEATLGN